MAASDADEIITGSLVNAAAIARYIKERNPQHVSLVAMGNSGIKPAAEDELCAEYIKSLLGGKPLDDIDIKIAGLKEHGGEHFFNPRAQDIFPKEDFYLCAKRDIFDFVIRIEKDNLGLVARKLLC